MHTPLLPVSLTMSTLGKHLLDSANTNGTSSTPGAQGSFGKVSTDGCGVQTDYEAKFSVLNQGLPALFKVMPQSPPGFVVRSSCG